MYAGPERRKKTPALKSPTELNGDGLPSRGAATAPSPLDRRTEKPRAPRHGLTARQRLLLEDPKLKGAPARS